MALTGNLLVSVGLLTVSVCISAVDAAETTWRDEAQRCYDNASQGRYVAYQGRTGIEACDRYVSQAREDEARRMEILKGIIPEVMRQNAQQQRDAQERFERSLRPPPDPTRCRTYVVGSSIYTDCNR